MKRLLFLMILCTIILVPLSFGQLSDGLVMCLNFNDDSTSTTEANDTTLFRHNASLLGTVVPGQEAVLGQAIGLNRTTDFAFVTNDGSFSQVDSFSYVVWGEIPTSVSGSVTLIRYGSSGGGDIEFLTDFSSVSGGRIEMFGNGAATQAATDITRSTNTPMMIGLRLDASQTALISYNETILSNDAINQSIAAGVSTGVNIGGWSGVGADFKFDQVAFWNRTLSDAEIVELDNSGAYTSCSDIVIIPPVPGFTVTLNDRFDSVALQNFTVTLSNATFSNTTTTTSGTITFINIGGAMDVDFFDILDDGGYFNTTILGVNGSENLVGTAVQSVLLITGASLVPPSSTVIFDWTSCTSQPGPIVCDTAFFVGQSFALLNINNNPINITSESTGTTVALNLTLNFTLDALENKTINLSFFTNLLTINSTEFLTGDTISNFTINLTGLNVTFTQTQSTTTGIIQFGVLTGLYNVSYNAATFANQNLSIALTGPTSIQNLTIVAFPFNSINFTILHEILGRGIPFFSGVPVDIEITGDFFSTNFSTSTGALFINLSIPGEYRITYVSNDFPQRDYYLDVGTGVHEEIELYLLPLGNSTDVTFTVRDNSGNPIQDALIMLKRYYVDTNSYRVIAMSRTNLNGASVINVDFNNAFYETFTTFAGFDRETLGTRIIALTFNIVLNIIPSAFDQQDVVEGVSSSISFNNVTQTFSYTFATDGSPLLGTIIVTRLNPNEEIVACSNSDTSASATILCVVNTTDITGNYVANGFVQVSGNDVQTNTLSIITGLLEDAKNEFGTVGVFFSILLAGTFAMLGLRSGPGTTVILFIVGLGSIAFFGFTLISTTVYVTIAIIGGILVYKMKR